VSFYDERFPEKWALDAVRSIRWINEIVAPRNQREVRNTPMATARYVWDLSMSAKTGGERMEFDGWFLAMNGQQHTFVYRDLADYQLDRQTIGTGTGAKLAFQLVKSYSAGLATYSRNITRPVTATVRVWVNGVELLSGWSVSRTTGIITFGSAPADGAVVAASCEFDVPVRFNQSSLDWQIAGKNPVRGLLWVCPGLSLIEVIGE
jgi:uncharacterized protein (TIGR02217 family)